MLAFPPCKINLGLHIIARRPDRYHELETCFYPVLWTDVLEIISAREFNFATTGMVIQGEAEDNLCVKAFRLMEKEHGIGNVSMHLHKIIPSGAGLGGGSSDAAFTLVMLNSLFSLNLSTDQLRNYASRLGSDCAFFVDPKPMIGSGRGEVLTPIEFTLKGKYIILIKPPIHVSTAEAYSNVTPQHPQESLTSILTGDISTWQSRLVNDFESSVFKKYPVIQNIKSRLYEHGAFYASMSGSGSSVFGLFHHEADLKDHFKDMQYWAGWLTA
jgi:4-diphosphocytidyl-2-C-methyl-D-erythritol kinase